MKDTPPPDHEARFCRGGVQSRVHQAWLIGMITKIV
jgi:hypothetical protein